MDFLMLYILVAFIAAGMVAIAKGPESIPRTLKVFLINPPLWVIEKILIGMTAVVRRGRA